MNKRGHFFVFEGIDGSGKTTQIHLLQKRIEQQGVRCMETKEPTDGPIGSLLRQCLTGRMNIDEYSISAMFAADRLDHLQNETDGLCHKIEEGISVISDRYVFSNYAYQSVSVPLEWLVQLNAQAAKLLRPDCHIFIDVDQPLLWSAWPQVVFSHRTLRNIGSPYKKYAIGIYRCLSNFKTPSVFLSLTAIVR